MKIFADTANVEDIKRINELGIIDGGTTNPTLVAREGKDWESVEKQICEIVDGPVSAEVTASEATAMVEQARELSKWADNIVVKIPMTAEGLKAVKVLSQEGIKTNITLVFSAMQGLLAAKAGATYVSPFLGRPMILERTGLNWCKNCARSLTTMVTRRRLSRPRFVTTNTSNR